MATLERLEELKIQYEQLCWLIEHTETTTQLKLLKEVCSGFKFKDEMKLADDKMKELYGDGYDGDGITGGRGGFPLTYG